MKTWIRLSAETSLVNASLGLNTALDLAFANLEAGRPATQPSREATQEVVLRNSRGDLRTDGQAVSDPIAGENRVIR